MASFTPPPIKFKRSQVPGARPTDSDLLVGEIAINLIDRIIFTKDSDNGKIVELGRLSDVDSDIAAIYARLLVMEAEEDSDNAVTRGDHDSDNKMLYHDYRAADSDFRVQYDSDIPKIYHDFKAGDSDLQYRIDSDLANFKVRNLADVRHITGPQHDQVIVWDSDSDTWKYGDGASRIANLKDVDIVTSPQKHGHVLAWDSDTNFWRPTYDHTITEMVRESFVATTGQTTFVLAQKAVGEIAFVRNGMMLKETAAFLDSEFSVYYSQPNNNNQVLRSGDLIEIVYVKSITTTIPDFTLDGGGA